MTGLRVVKGLAFLIVGGWCSLALLLADGGPTLVRVGCWVVCLVLVGLANLPSLANTKVAALASVQRPLAAHRFAVTFGVVAGVVAQFFSLTPRDDRSWIEPQSRMPSLELSAEGFVVHDLRAFRYGAVPRSAWRTEAFSFDELVGADLGVSRFSALEPLAHTFVSFRFSTGQVLVASVEIRKERGESFSPVRGLFRQYEKIIVLGDERDLVENRAVYLQEEVFLYPLMVSKQRIVQFLRSVLVEAQSLHERPQWYNTLTASCSTTFARHLSAMHALPYDYRALFPGYVDSLAYDLGWLGEEELAVLRQRFNIVERAKKAAGTEDFSEAIRQPKP